MRLLLPLAALWLTWLLVAARQAWSRHLSERRNRRLGALLAGRLVPAPRSAPGPSSAPPRLLVSADAARADRQPGRDRARSGL